MRLRARVERAKQASTGQLLLRAARLFNERALARVQARAGARVHARGGPSVRMRHTALIPHVDWEGTRLTELAARLGVSKPAAGKLVGELERLGVVRCLPDPSDGRAKLVRFTTRGGRALLHGLGVMQALERELAREVGRARLERLHADLAKLLDALER